MKKRLVSTIIISAMVLAMTGVARQRRHLQIRELPHRQAVKKQVRRKLIK